MNTDAARGANGVPRPRPGLAVLVALGSLAAFGPLALDLYLPSLPEIGARLHASDALVQLTLGACMVGLALGQLVAGPLSDRFGRRAPLLVGVAAFVVCSVLCAVAPSIEVLIVARALQGLSGAAGIVIANAVARDIGGTSGTAGVLSVLQGISGIAPVVAPLAGGALLLVLDWRGLFVTLAVLGALIFVLALRVVPDSLPPERRQTHGVGRQLHEIGGLLADWRFILLAVAMGMGGAILFTYIQMSPLLFQGGYGLDAQQFSWLFAINSCGIVLGTQLNRMMLRRWRPRTIALGALVVSMIGSASVVIIALLGGGLVPIVVALFFVIGAMGCIFPNIVAEGLSVHDGSTGAAAAVLGAFQFLAGSAVAPVATLAGTNTVVMSSTMGLAAVAAFVLVAVATRGRGASAIP